MCKRGEVKGRGRGQNHLKGLGEEKLCVVGN